MWTLKRSNPVYDSDSDSDDEEYFAYQPTKKRQRMYSTESVSSLPYLVLEEENRVHPDDVLFYTEEHEETATPEAQEEQPNAFALFKMDSMDEQPNINNNSHNLLLSLSRSASSLATNASSSTSSCFDPTPRIFAARVG